MLMLLLSSQKFILHFYDIFIFFTVTSKYNQKSNKNYDGAFIFYYGKSVYFNRLVEIF